MERFILVRYGIALLTLVTVILFGYAVWQVQQRNALPDVHITGGEVYDNGLVTTGPVLTHTFKVENPHPFALGLEASIVGCACTTATISASVIPPHGVTEVTLRVEPENGKFTGSAAIITTHGGKRTETWLIVMGKSLPTKTRPVGSGILGGTI